ncbi:MAG: fold metallo-hydrolase [Mucilaginibacter sp.]|nr:fold metallo-hydrolase [Mucilaginibacter sp.]
MQIIGNKFLVDFGMAKAVLDIQSATSLAFTITKGPKTNTTETVTIKLTKLRPKLFLLTWKEANGNTITQIQDHKNKKVYMNWTHPDGEFINMTGTIKPL